MVFFIFLYLWVRDKRRTQEMNPWFVRPLVYECNLIAFAKYHNEYRSSVR